jgi:hypothetical protein
MESVNEPVVIQNSDFMYKTENNWVNDTTVREKTEFEINMLKEKLNAIYQYFFRNNATGGNKFNLRI